MKTALTIAGSDPTGGAGLQADIKAFNALGVYGLGVPSVLTAQSTRGVHSIHEIDAGFVSEQLEILIRDITPDAVKTGMLYSPDIISTVSEKAREYSLKNLVVDPVTVSSTGVRLMEERGLGTMKEKLFPLASVITPNVYEASALTGIEIESGRDVKAAAVKLRDLGAGSVVITGGHLGGRAEDLFFDGEEFITMENEMLDGEFHGTGCLFSSVIAACLALGYSRKEAFIKAKDFVWNAMKESAAVGPGMRVLKF